MMDGAAIIATGAEVALAPECSKLIKAMGITIHILREPELAEMSLVSREHRMFLKDINNNTEVDMSKESIWLYAQERSSYEALADLSLENNGTEEEGLEKLLALIKSVTEKQSPE
jgi:shikimate kinase